MTVPVEPGQALAALDQFGPWTTVNGYTVAARLTNEVDRSVVDLLIQGGTAGSRVSQVGRHYGELPATQLATLAAGGESQELAVVGNYGGLHRLQGAPLDQDQATLTVPALEVAVPATAQVRLPVTSGPVGKEFTLGQWPVTIVRSELVDDELGLYFDLGPVEAIALIYFRPVRLNGKLIPHSMGEVDQDTGQLVYLQFPLPARAKEVTVTFGDARIMVQGPWELHLHD